MSSQPKKRASSKSLKSTTLRQPRLGLIFIEKYGPDQVSKTIEVAKSSTQALLSDVFVPRNFDVETKNDQDIYKSIATQHQVDIHVVNYPIFNYGLYMKCVFDSVRTKQLDVLTFADGNLAFDFSHLDSAITKLQSEQFDIVLGSRFKSFRTSSSKKMPKHRYFANVFLTKLGHLITNYPLTDWHSAYRVLNAKILDQIPYTINSDNFIFDYEFLLQAHELGLSVAEIDIPPYIGQNISGTNGFRYIFNALMTSCRYGAHKIGFGEGSSAFNSLGYEFKDDAHTSHSYLIEKFAQFKPSQVLDVGCADGYLGEQISRFGHVVIGIDAVDSPLAKKNLSKFYHHDIEKGIPEELADQRFDIILLADVLEHFKDTRRVLAELVQILADDGQLIVSVPNINHWYSRIKIATGLFSYDKRGIFDEGHVRFFNRITFERFARSAGLKVVEVDSVGIPFNVMLRGLKGLKDDKSLLEKGFKVLRQFDYLLTRILPSLFAYQNIYVLKKHIPVQAGYRIETIVSNNN